MEISDDMLTDDDKERIKQLQGFKDRGTISEDNFSKQISDILSEYQLTKPCPNCGKEISKEADSCSNCMGDIQNQEWFFEEYGKRSGPFSSLKMVEFIKSERISYGSLIWKKDFSDWKKVENTELGSYIIKIAGPPPLSGEHVKNTYMWILAFWPLISNILEKLLLQTIYGSLWPLYKEGFFWHITITVIAVNILLCWFDSLKLKKAGYNADKFSGWIWLVPVYMYSRAKYLKQNQACVIVWIIMFILSLFA